MLTLALCGGKILHRARSVGRFRNLQWIEEHGSREMWQDAQVCLVTYPMSYAAISWIFPLCAGRSWAAWLLQREQEPIWRQDLTTLGFQTPPGLALQYITNQNAGKTRDAWLGWWRLHCHESQPEWWCSGFREIGINVKLPLTERDQIDLLTFLGEHGDSSNRTRGMWRTILCFNACRLLRYGGADAALPDWMEKSATVTPAVCRGIEAYQRYRAVLQSEQTKYVLRAKKCATKIGKEVNTIELHDR